jgi:hypothetical protein
MLVGLTFSSSGLNEVSPSVFCLDTFVTIEPSRQLLHAALCATAYVRPLRAESPAYLNEPDPSGYWT